MIPDRDQLENYIKLAIIEDVGDGDHTSKANIEKDQSDTATLLVKQEGILAGIEAAQVIFKIIDEEIILDDRIGDGNEIKNGDIAFKVSGNTLNLMQGERLVLNCLQRMSGIATLTRRYVEAVNGTKARITDTRKTTPNFRVFEKWAVAIGGGINHRFGLFDMILIKDNHIASVGSVSSAISNAQFYLEENGIDIKIEIEAANIDQVEEIIKVGDIDRIMLDNFTPEDLAVAVKKIDGQFETEASGGITLDTVRRYAETGVDLISIGALTHSAPSIDMSLKILD